MHMPRDSEATKRRLLDAAAAEFAERGIAGARVDRIAAAAGANKALIYSYFGSKEGLFDTVFNALCVDTLHDVPIDVDDLPAYAGRLFDRNLGHPLALRLAIWRSLERGEGLPDEVVAANRDKIAAIAAAQRDGRVGDRFPAEELMVMVTGLSILGAPFLAMPNDQERRRRSVVDAVRLLTEAEGEKR
jgi:AcrR family transcriptional regulator